MSSRTISKVGLAALILLSMPCFAGALGAPDANCNPAVDTPVAGGCTWYNFYAFIADGSIHAGSSFTNYYVAASDPPWTITTTAPEVIRVVDGGHQGDVFDVYDNGVLLGETSATPIDPNHSCAGDTTGAGTDPAACWNDPLMSQGTFPLAAGNHSITVVWKQRVPGGDSGLQWFEIGAPTSTTSLNFIGSMPHIATEGDWNTTFTLVNKGGTSAEANLSAFGDNGLPLMMPLSLLQSSSSFIASSLDRTLAANASLIAETSGPSNLPVLEGGAQLSAAGPVDGFAVFHRVSDGQEAVVPLETRNASSYTMAFDNTNNLAVGIAVENISTQAANILVVVRDDTGAQIGTGNISLPGSAHTAFMLNDQFPWTANIRGTAQFITPTGGQISLLGIRCTPQGTLTSIPVFANVATGSSSIAHLAAAGGWDTSFVLVNTGTTTAQIHLAFFADDGTPLPLSISFPQVSGTASVATSVDRQLAPGATLIVDTTGPMTSPVTFGSAQLTTDGNVGAFAIFDYQPNTNQAAVAFDARNATGYVIAFDHTQGATGVAVNNTSGFAINIPVIVRDDTGAQIATGAVPLNANGHKAFLITDMFPATAGIRGTIELDTPAGSQIAALALRAPSTLTFTSMPAMAK